MRRLNRISPSLVQDWVTQAHTAGLSPRSIRKSRTLTPEEYGRLLTAFPKQHRLMIETLIEAGLRWGELIALKPRHIDLLRRCLAVEEAIVEVSKKHSPTGQRYLAKPYPKDNEPCTFGVRQAWLDPIAEHIKTNGIGHDDLLFATTAGTPISRNTFRTRIWLPAVKASGIDFPVRVHDYADLGTTTTCATRMPRRRSRPASLPRSSASGLGTRPRPSPCRPTRT